MGGNVQPVGVAVATTLVGGGLAMMRAGWAVHAVVGTPWERGWVGNIVAGGCGWCEPSVAVSGAIVLPIGGAVATTLVGGGLGMMRAGWAVCGVYRTPREHIGPLPKRH